MISHTKQQGFSLLEMLIYIAILVLLLAIIMNIIVSVSNSMRIIKSLRNNEDSAVLSLERVGREVRQANSIDVSSVFGSHPGRLVLVGTDADDAPRKVEFYLSGGRVFLKENDVDTGALTQTGSKVSSLIFYHFVGVNSEGVRTEMTVESGTSTHYRSEKFYSTTILR